VQQVGLQRLEHEAAMAVHDRLGHAGGARRIDDPQRMVERYRRERAVGCAGERIGPAHHLHRCACGTHRAQARPAVEVGHEDDRAHAGQLPHELANHVAPVEVLAAVAIAVDREQHLRLDLPEAVEHAHRPHVGRRARPDRAQARGRQQRDHGLRNVRHVRDAAIAGGDAEPLQRRGERAGLRAQAIPADLGARLQFRLEHQRRTIGVGVHPRRREQVLGVIERFAFEPARAGHLARRQSSRTGRVGDHASPLVERLPEILEVLDRPGPQRLVVGEREPASLPQPLAITRDAGARDSLAARPPQDFRGRHGPRASSVFRRRGRDYSHRWPASWHAPCRERLRGTIPALQRDR